MHNQSGAIEKCSDKPNSGAGGRFASINPQHFASCALAVITSNHLEKWELLSFWAAKCWKRKENILRVKEQQEGLSYKAAQWPGAINFIEFHRSSFSLFSVCWLLTGSMHMAGAAIASKKIQESQHFKLSLSYESSELVIFLLIQVLHIASCLFDKRTYLIHLMSWFTTLGNQSSAAWFHIHNTYRAIPHIPQPMLQIDLYILNMAIILMLLLLHMKIIMTTLIIACIGQLIRHP